MTILVIDIVPDEFRPYYLAGKGKKTGAYIRINGTSRAVDERKLQLIHAVQKKKSMS